MLVLSVILFFAVAVLGGMNMPCIGAGGRAGVCIPTSQCTSEGGTITNGACPGDPSNVQCCTKPSCSNTVFSGGNCRWTSDCDGASPGFGCPGPSQFVCCRKPNGHYGVYATPPIPTSGCKPQAINGAKKIIAAWPGRIRAVGCYRNEPCVENREHGCGRATDLMCSDADGLATNGGSSIAEWVMNNHKALNVKYVIFGQRIWNPSRDAIAPWSKWRVQKDLGDITQNHWDHVHVSYN